MLFFYFFLGRQPQIQWLALISVFRQERRAKSEDGAGVLKFSLGIIKQNKDFGANFKK